MLHSNFTTTDNQLVVVAQRIQLAYILPAYYILTLTFFLLSFSSLAQSNNKINVPAMDASSKDAGYRKKLSKADAQRSLDATIVAGRKTHNSDHEGASSFSNGTKTNAPTIQNHQTNRDLKNNSGDPVHGVDVKLGNKNKLYGDPIPGLDDKPRKNHQANGDPVHGVDVKFGYKNQEYGDPVHGVDVKLGATQKTVNRANKSKVEHWGDPHENLNGYNIKKPVRKGVGKEGDQYEQHADRVN